MLEYENNAPSPLNCIASLIRFFPVIVIFKIKRYVPDDAFDLLRFGIQSVIVIFKIKKIRTG